MQGSVLKCRNYLYRRIEMQFSICHKFDVVTEVYVGGGIVKLFEIVL